MQSRCLGGLALRQPAAKLPSASSSRTPPHAGATFRVYRTPRPAQLLQPPAVASPSTEQQQQSSSSLHEPLSPHQQQAASSSTSQQQQQQQQQGSFNWFRNWYPVAIMSQLQDDRPVATQLLGVNMVIWKDGKGNWQVFEDRCPHRLAPLSEGRLEPNKGTLMCSYHGWEFDSEGHCSSIPQIGEPAAHKAACSSKRTCAIRYPAQVAQGLLWVWPDASSADLAAVSPPALSEQWGREGWTMLGGDWFARDLEYGYDTMMENLFDPSHIPFAHHGIMGTATRDKAQPLSITTKVDVTAQGGFQLFRDSAPFRTAAPTDTFNNFVPPVLNSSTQTNTAKGTSLVLTFYGIPTAPGKSRVITAFFTSAKVPQFVVKAAAAAEWWFHLGQNQVLDSDAMLLHVQERLLHEGRDPNWRSAFFMPAGADLGIIKFRTWYHDCAGGGVPWPGALSQQGLGPVKPREVVMDRYSQHVAHCKSCSAAVKWIQRLQAAALGLAALAAATCTAAVTAAAVTASSAAEAAVAAPAAASGAVQAAVGALAAVPTWQTVLLAAAVALLLVGHQLLGKLKQRFFFVDYVHADRK